MSVNTIDASLLAKMFLAGAKNLESKIDILVYHLYGLTFDEVLIVDPDTPIKREEYEKRFE